ncbi:armadillo-type protein [Naematelia encephala]|uniref:Armadillo-type protein n=1 Tax=Naematelia encephala TaxID=71784 RepID=A0A1Y2BLB3_9TREE|nr:armadillo-type protein [Naematelia encephala]
MSTEHLLGDIGLVLEAVMANEDEPRRMAEAHLRRFTTQQPAEVLLLLAQIGAQGVGGFQVDQRFMATLLLLNLAFRPLPGLFLNQQARLASAPFDVIRELTRQRIETVLCAGLSDEMDIRMRKALGDCCAGWAEKSGVRKRPFMSLPPVLLSLTTSPHPFHRFTPFQLINRVPSLLIDSVSDPIPIEQLAHLILAGIHDPSVDVRVEAIKAMRSLISEALTDTERKQVGAGLVLEAFKILPTLPPDIVHHVLRPFVDLAEYHPNLFLPSLDAIFPYLLSLASPPAALLPSSYSFSPYPMSSMEYDDWEEVAGPATEILASLAELRPNDISFWENGKLGNEIVGLLLGWLVAGLASDDEDCSSWIAESNVDDSDPNYPEQAEETLYRIVFALSESAWEDEHGRHPMMASALLHAQALLQQEDWRCRYAGLAAIWMLIEYGEDDEQASLEAVLPLIAPAARDPHPRVRYAFLECLARTTSARPQMKAQYAERSFEILLELLQDNVSRVRAHAAQAISSFFDHLEEPSQVLPHVENIVRGLLQAFASAPLYVQEQVVDTLGFVAAGTYSAFTSCYRDVMDLFLRILQTPMPIEGRELSGRAIEAAMHCGRAVGKATFSLDAIRLAQVLLKMQGELSENDLRARYVMDGWESMCRILRSDFKPFVPHVFPPLLQEASRKITTRNPIFGTSLLSTDDLVGDELDADSDEVRDKHVALDHLAVFVSVLQSDIEQYYDSILAIAMDGLKATGSSTGGVRRASAHLLAALMSAGTSLGRISAPTDTDPILQALIRRVSLEDEVYSIWKMCDDNACSLRSSH